MVYYCCLDYLALFKAFNAERMLGEVSLTVPTPAGIIAPLSRGTTFPLVLAAGLFEMLLTVAVAVTNESRTTRVATGARWFHRHGSLRVDMSEK